MGDSERVYSDKRVLYPHPKLDREDSEQHVRVTWDDALSNVTKKLKRTIGFNHYHYKDFYDRDMIILAEAMVKSDKGNSRFEIIEISTVPRR